MLFSQDRDQIRRYYLQSWQKAQQGQPLEPLERMIAEVVAEHPEYHAALQQNEDKALGREYLPETGETNPFLHLGMHLAIREQVSVNRPQGIKVVHRKLAEKLGGAMEAEHLMMEALAESLWLAQRHGTAPDEQAYMLKLKEMAARLGA